MPSQRFKKPLMFGLGFGLGFKVLRVLRFLRVWLWRV